MDEDIVSEVRVRICSVAAQYVGSQQVGAETPQLEFSSAAHRSGEEKAKDKEKFGHIYSYNDVVRLRVARALSYVRDYNSIDNLKFFTMFHLNF